MDMTPNTPRSLILSTRLYQALLAVYPSEFRQAYGGPMLQVFRDCTLKTLRENGTAGLLPLWIRMILDTVQTALDEHIQRGLDMSKSKFVKLSGWAMMLGGLALTLGWLASARPAYDRFNQLSMRIDLYINAAEIPLFVMSALLLSVGFIGLFIRYGRATGSFGRISLGLGAVSGLVSAAGAIGTGVSGGEPWWGVWFLGMVFQFLGLALFGIANLRQRSLPRWNGLPVFAGMWIPLYVLVGMIIEQGSGRWVELPEAANMILLLLTLAGVAGLGYLLQSDSQPSDTTAYAT